MSFDVKSAVEKRYSDAAAKPEAQLCCPTGYNVDELKTWIPEEVLNISYGCGTPAGLGEIAEGETVVDIGSGGGIDCFEAARRVGESGKVIGVDMTDKMLDVARRNAPIVAKNLGHAAPVTDFRKGDAEAMPVDNASVDLVISNCVINLAPDKQKVFNEMARVTRPGGRFCVSDICADQEVPNYLRFDEVRWGACLVGALTIDKYLAGLRKAGFVGVRATPDYLWQSIDGIRFFSITVRGSMPVTADRPATTSFNLVGPFSEVTTDSGVTLKRGVPVEVDADTAADLRVALATELIAEGTQYRATQSVLPKDGPCIWRGAYAIYLGPFATARDDDAHTYVRGVPMEICEKTETVLAHASYAPFFSIFHRAANGEPVTSGAQVACDPATGCC
jgi:SAM-dependent methyltransferase